MIFKSRTRKTNNFRQAVEYVLGKKQDGFPTWILLHNIDASPFSKTEIIQQFKEHDKLRKRRANGIGLFHDTISFASSDKDYLLKHPYIMEEIAWQYITKRTNGLAMAYPHWDTPHPHVHILMSGQSNKNSKCS